MIPTPLQSKCSTGKKILCRHWGYLPFYNKLNNFQCQEKAHIRLYLSRVALKTTLDTGELKHNNINNILICYIKLKEFKITVWKVIFIFGGSGTAAWHDSCMTWQLLNNIQLLLPQLQIQGGDSITATKQRISENKCEFFVIKLNQKKICVQWDLNTSRVFKWLKPVRLSNGTVFKPWSE